MSLHDLSHYLGNLIKRFTFAQSLQIIELSIFTGRGVLLKGVTSFTRHKKVGQGVIDFRVLLLGGSLF